MTKKTPSLHSLWMLFFAGQFLLQIGTVSGANKPVVQTFKKPVVTRRVIAQASNTSSKLPALAGDADITTDVVGRYEDWISTSSLSTPGYLSLPELNVMAPSTTYSLYSDYSDTGTLNLDLVDNETTIAENRVPSLPLTPLPVEELEDLTSSSKRSKKIHLINAICQTLSSNQQLRIERLRPEISNTAIESAESEFDTTLDAGLFTSSNHSSTLGALPKDRSSTFTREEERQRVSRDTDFNIGVSGRLPTGTNYNLGFTANRSVSNSTEPFYTLNTNLNITQNLLRGAGCEVNCLRVWTAQNNYVISLYQLQQTLIDMVTDVQTAYWDMYLAFRTLQIRLKAYEVAKEQRERAEEFVRVGKSPPLEALASQAEEASRISDVINAAADLKRQEILFLRLINPECTPQQWRTLFYPADKLILPVEPLIPEQRIALAQYYRPDLRQAQIDLSNSELEVVRTQNGLLPVLDLVSELGYTGVGDTFGQAFKEMKDRDFRNWRVGLQFSYPLQNRAARADNRRANFQKSLAEEAIHNFCQIIEVDIRTAVIEIERTKRLIESTEITRKLREEELAAEIEKYRVGRSTSLLVAQAQRDLTDAELQEVSAEVSNIRSYLQLYRSEGTSLQRLGIQPITITAASGVPRD
jgi:outer membrane protein TolC